jgi:hypothetical protein
MGEDRGFSSPAGAMDGYWGAKDAVEKFSHGEPWENMNGPANRDWCEANYDNTFYVAELFNTLSCIPICTFALFGLKQCKRYNYETKFTVAYAAVFVIGLGSAAFHGTLTRWGQVLDEVPMLWASLAFLYIALTMNGPRPQLSKSLAAFGAASTYAYFTKGFEFFVVTYTLTVLTLSLASFKAAHESPHRAQLQPLQAAAAVLYCGGFLCLWIPEVLYCPENPALSHLKLHAWCLAPPFTFAYSCIIYIPNFWNCSIAAVPERARPAPGST